MVRQQRLVIPLEIEKVKALAFREFGRAMKRSIEREREYIDEIARLERAVLHATVHHTYSGFVLFVQRIDPSGPELAHFLRQAQCTKWNYKRAEATLRATDFVFTSLNMWRSRLGEMLGSYCGKEKGTIRLRFYDH